MNQLIGFKNLTYFEELLELNKDLTSGSGSRFSRIPANARIELAPEADIV